LSSSPANPGFADQLPDLLHTAADDSTVDAASIDSGDRLDAAMGWKQLQPISQDPLVSDSSETASLSNDPRLAASFPSEASFRYDSSADVDVSPVMADLRRTLRRRDHQYQQREFDLVRIIATLF
jgi:hypothetical protein